MNDDELDALFEEICKPYSKKEFDLHSESRLIKSWFEITHAHNYDLIDLLGSWTKYLDGNGPRPERKLWVMLRPGNNNDNAACARLHDIVGYYSQFDHGKAPRLPIVVFASRSSATLIDRLDDFFYSRHITEAYHHIKEFFSLISYSGKPKMSREEFAASLRSEIDAFIGECAQYAVELGEHIRKREEELKNGEKVLKVKLVKDEKPKKPANGRGRHTKFMDDQRKIFLEYLQTHPVTRSYSKIVRARECWRLHQSDWDKAAKSGDGYKNHKILAQSV